MTFCLNACCFKFVILNGHNKNGIIVIQAVLRITLSIILAFLSFTPASACRCDLITSTTIENIQNANYISLIKVKNILSAGSREYFKIIIDELVLYEGNSTNEILVTGANKSIDSTYWTSCDLGIEINDEWLIYSNESSGKTWLLPCSKSFRYKDKYGYRDFMDGNKTKTLNEINNYFNKPLINYSINNGVLDHYYPNGKMEFELTYEEGIKQGVSRYYFPNGAINGIEYYKDGRLEGIQKRYFMEGTLDFIKHFRNGIEVDSSNYYEYNIDSGKYYMWFTSYRNVNGEFLHSKSFVIPGKFILTKKLYYLRDEIIYDTVSKNTSHISYYPNGIVKIFYKMNEDHEQIGDEIEYNEKGNVIKKLRVKKGTKNKIIYIDTTYWPNYKKDNEAGRE